MPAQRADAPAGQAGPRLPVSRERERQALRRELPGWLVVVVPALAELMVGGYRIAGPSLWRDEAATIAGSQRPVRAILALVRNADAVHGPYYLMMHFVIAAGGTSETVLRLPSLIAMSLAAALTAALAMRLARATRLPAPAVTGLAAGLLLTAVPLTTRYAQEARPYALTSLFAVLATYLLVRAAGSGRRPWWACYAAALAVTGMFNLFAVLLALAHGVSLLAARQTGSVASRAADGTPATQVTPALPPSRRAAPHAAAHGTPASRFTRRAAPGAAVRGIPASRVTPASRFTRRAAPGAAVRGIPAPGVIPAPPSGLPPGGAGAADTCGAISAETTHDEMAAAKSGPPGAAEQVADGSLVRWLAACVAAAVLLAPMTVLSLGQSAQLRWVTAPGLSALATLLRDFAGSVLLIPVAAVLAGLGCVAGGGMRRGAGLTITVIALPWLVLPPTLLLAVSLVDPVYVERYVVFCLPALSVLSAAGLTWLVRLASTALRRPGVPVGRSAQALAAAPSVMLALLVVAVLIAPQQAVRLATARADNLRAVAAAIAASERPGDAVVYLPWDARMIGLAYPAPFLRLRDIELGASPAASATLRGLEAPAGVVASRIRGVSRLWLVQWAQPLAPGGLSPTDLVAARAMAGMRLIMRRHFASVVLSLYAAR